MKKIDKASAAIGAAAAIGAIAYGVPAIANAAGSAPSPSAPSPSASTAPQSRPDYGRHFSAEKELTSATAAKIKAAVLKKLPGATIERMSAEDAGEGTGAAYEAHVTKSDGTRVEVLLDKSFAVTTVKTDVRGGGFGGRFGGGHGAESELTGTTAAKVKAAVLTSLPGATIERMSAEDAGEGTGAAYEANVTKSDGTHVQVLLDKNFKIISTRTAPAGRGHFGGPPPGMSGSGGTPSSDDSGSPVGPADYPTINA